jgi:hypothetical protein
MYDDAAGSDNHICLAVASECMTDISSSSEGQVYSGLLSDESVFTVVSGLTARGLFVTQPYAIYYGANGSVTWSNENEPLNVTTGSAGSDRVIGDTIVAGLPFPSGSGAGGLLWSLSSVIRMDWVGGQAIFKFSKLTASSSILAQNGVIELDGMYYWVGEDRFFVSDGQSVKTLPNTFNLNWFFNNVNRTHAQKIWAEVNTRFGEIIWHFPSGESTECDKAIVFNTVDNCWYDYEESRTSGHMYKSFPILSGVQKENLVRFKLSGVSGNFEEGDQIEGVSSKVIFEITLIQDTSYYAKAVTVGGKLIVNESISNLTQTGAGAISVLTECTPVYMHEYGMDKIEDDNQLAIESYFTTSNIAVTSLKQPTNMWTRLERVELDFVQVSNMKMEVLTKEYAKSSVIGAMNRVFTPTEEYIDTRLQGRYMYLKFTSNDRDGDYQLGRILLHMSPGDKRS